MGRPPLAVGTYGKITIYPNADGFRARSYCRDHDGVRREVERWGKTRAQAERLLKLALTDRSGVGTDGDITADTRLRALADRWLADLDAGVRASGTKRMYHLATENYLAPALGALRLREIDVPAADRALRAIRTTHGPGAAKTARSVLSGMLATAVRHGAMPSNPVRDTSSIPTSPSSATGQCMPVRSKRSLRRTQMRPSKLRKKQNARRSASRSKIERPPIWAQRVLL